MTDVRKILANALVQAAMEDDKSQKVTVSMRVLEIMVGRDLRSLTMGDLGAIAESASLRAVEEARLAGVQVAASGEDIEARARRLKLARKARFRSAADLARRVGYNPVTVRAHESAQNGYPITTASAYAKALGVTPEWLLYGRGEGPTSAPISGHPQTLTG